MDRPTFTPTLVGLGYDRAQVDEAVERILRRDPAMTADAVVDLAFRARMYRRGYDTGEVDAWLDAAVVELGGRPAEPLRPAAPAVPTALAAASEPEVTAPTTGDFVRAAVMIVVVVAAAVWI